MKLKVGFLRRSIKLINQASLIREKKSLITNIRNKGRDITTDPSDVKKIIRE